MCTILLLLLLLLLLFEGIFDENARAQYVKECLLRMEFNPSKVELLKNFKEMLLGLIQLAITYGSSIPLLCKGRLSVC